jgi:hypothetical protein
MKNKKIVNLLVFVLLATLLTGCGASPGKVVQNFFQAVDNGEIEESMSYLSTSTLQALGTEKWRIALVEISNQMTMQGGLKSVKVIEESVNGEIAQITVNIMMKDGTEELDSINMIKENGDWKISLDPWSK